MSLPVYLALTGAEFPHRQASVEKPGYMACHFSPYGTGLSNLPKALPPGCLLILNDRIPVCGHNPEQVCRELAAVAEEFGCDGVLLDFQRQADPLTEQIARAAAASLPCPVAVTEGYAAGLECPVFLTPPLYIPPEESLNRWPGREIWLELGLWSQLLTVTEDGCAIGPVLPYTHREKLFESEELCCGYWVEVAEDGAKFTLQRTPEQLVKLLRRCSLPQVTRAVGLYQELGNLF